jgi:hypothetical protein
VSLGIALDIEQTDTAGYLSLATFKVTTCDDGGPDIAHANGCDIANHPTEKHVLKLDMVIVSRKSTHCISHGREQ